MSLLHEEITDKILAAFYNVYNELGYGFLEKIYENAIVIELTSMGLEVQTQVPVTVRYRGQVVGEHQLDLLVDGKIVIELKAAESIASAHEAQLINYLRATGLKLGLLLNFGKKPEFRRKVF